MKISISINDDLLHAVDEFADSNFMSRSGFMSLACAQYLDAKKLQRLLEEMTMLLRRIATAAESGSIDEEAQKQLLALENLVAMMQRP